MRIRLLAGGHLGATDIHVLAADARRAMLLYDLAVGHGFERQCYQNGEGVLYVLVEGGARPLLDAALGLVQAPERCQPFYTETDTSDAHDPEVSAVWYEYGPDAGASNVIYELEEEA